MKNALQSIIGMALLLFFVQASAVTNPAHAQCMELSELTPARMASIKHGNPIWESPEVRQVYLAVLDRDIGKYQSLIHKYRNDTASRAGMLFAAIVRHDISLMHQAYSKKADIYIKNKTHADALYWSSVCNFKQGVSILLKNGVNPNNNTGSNSAFNIALLYNKTQIPIMLLDAGYKISGDYKQCKSSKYILKNRGSNIPLDVATKIRKAVCTSSDRLQRDKR